MIALLLILIPLLGGFVSFFIKEDRAVRIWALLVSFALMGVAIAGTAMVNNGQTIRYATAWMGNLGSSFTVQLDGLSSLLCLLTGIAYPLIIIATWRSTYSKPNNFFALMLLTAAGMIGVFTAMDALLFYFFWELALIPMYFICSGWGGERRIPVTFKFFVYTFVASVVMLIGLLYLYFQTPDKSFAFDSFYNLHLENSTQHWVFWLLFIAFAVKMPLFPFHTWQPDTYEQAPTAATMVLSGVMVKMGVFGVLRWVMPVVPAATYSWGDTVTTSAVIGIIYTSLIAMRQDDLKRLIAYSSIAHIGLMVAAIFAGTKSGLQGMMMQLFNHGVNIIGLWIIVELIERQFGTRRLSELGGIAQKAPAMATLFVLLALANISLPLTNAFVGEFLMFTGIFISPFSKFNFLYTMFAVFSIVLSAVYTLVMVRKVLFGTTVQRTDRAHDLMSNERLALIMLVLLIFVLGVYPQPLLNVTDSFVDTLLEKADFTQFKK